MLQKWITEVCFCKFLCCGWSRPKNLSVGLRVRGGILFAS